MTVTITATDRDTGAVAQEVVRAGLPASVKFREGGGRLILHATGIDDRDEFEQTSSNLSPFVSSGSATTTQSCRDESGNLHTNEASASGSTRYELMRDSADNILGFTGTTSLQARAISSGPCHTTGGGQSDAWMHFEVTGDPVEVHLEASRNGTSRVATYVSVQRMITWERGGEVIAEISNRSGSETHVLQPGMYRFGTDLHVNSERGEETMNFTVSLTFTAAP